MRTHFLVHLIAECGRAKKDHRECLRGTEQTHALFVSRAAASQWLSKLELEES